MLFNTPQFFLFLAVVLTLFYAAPKSWRNPLLLVSSYFFYMSWNWRFIPLLLSLTIIDYVAALVIDRSPGHRRRKLALVISICANLGLLGFFKYYNFLAGNLAHLLGRPQDSFWLRIILPLGISFHTFQSISYVVDVYRRQQSPIRNPIDYALFISFFPQLVAGSIVRAREFFADLYHWRKPSGNEILRGVLLILLGLAKKMAGRRSVGANRRPLLQRCSCLSWGALCMVRRGSIWHSNLLRFLGLHRHGHRHGAVIRVPFPH